MRPVLERNEAIRKAHSEYQAFSGTPAYREMYEARLKWERDHNSLVNSAREEGKQQGKEQGLEQGEKHKALDAARRMKGKGLDVQLIQEVTGLSTEEIEQL